MTASDTFSKKNTNRTIEETFVETQKRVDAFKRGRHARAARSSVMAAFGCNYEGDIDPQKVIGLIDAPDRHRAATTTLTSSCIQLADTMGWANPLAIRRMVGLVQDRWPDKRINLHLHDTRGLGLANAFAAMEMGVDDFDSAVGGLGGCPYARLQGRGRQHLHRGPRAHVRRARRRDRRRPRAS